MSKVTNAAAALHLLQTCTSLGFCWRVTRADGEVILGTQHDRDLVIAPFDTSEGDLGGRYLADAAITGSDVRSTSDLSVDNMEVEGAVDPGGITIIDLSPADIEAGLFDDAGVVLFAVDWSDPEAWQIVLVTGTLGEIRRTAEGAYTAELRGLLQKYAQQILRTYGASCDAELGDARCTKDISSFLRTGTVTAVINRRRFTVTLSGSQDILLYAGGEVTWTAGENLGFKMEVKRPNVGDVEGEFELFLPMPRPVEIGDTLNLSPGCDKSPGMCKVAYDNLINFKGHGAWCPGLGEIAAFGGQTTERRARPPEFLAWPRSID